MFKPEYDWYGLYADKWGNAITPEAIVHPAKYARALIHKIYLFAAEHGMLHPGGILEVDEKLLQELRDEIDKGLYRRV